MPAGRNTMRVRQKAAPVSLPAAAMAAVIAAVSSSWPLPFAPKSRTFTAPLSDGKVCIPAMAGAASNANAVSARRKLARTIGLGGMSLCHPRQCAGGQQSVVMAEIGIDHSLHAVFLHQRLCMYMQIAEPAFAADQLS